MYLTWGEPPAEVAEKIDAVSARADRLGRGIRFGIRLHVIVRDPDSAAWAAAEELISELRRCHDRARGFSSTRSICPTRFP